MATATSRRFNVCKLSGMKDMKHDPRDFHYSLTDGWKPIEDPLASLSANSDEALALAGYFPSFRIGDNNGVYVQVALGNDRSPYPYFIDFTDGGYDWVVYTSDFPSFFEVMHKFAVICQAATLQEAYDETEALRRVESERTDELLRTESKKE